MDLNTDNKVCRNCEADMPEQSLYCPKCSQKNTDGKIPIWAFVKDMLENLFNLDSKLFKTAFGLFIPGKLTNEFFYGKHKSFATPSRMFLASTILFFASVGLLVDKEMDNNNFKGGILGIQSESKNKAGAIKGIDAVKKGMGDNMTPEMKTEFDSIRARIMRDSFDADSTNMTIFYEPYTFASGDFINLSADSMIQKYKIEEFWDVIFFKQIHKVRQNPKSLFTSLIGNMTWMLLLLIPSIALIFKLLYIRRDKYYVEHLVFLFHIHAFGLLVGVGLLNLLNFTNFEYEVSYTPWIVLGLILYIFIALKQVYEQGWIKTFIKLFMIAISYVIFFVIWFTISAIASFLIF